MGHVALRRIMAGFLLVAFLLGQCFIPVDSALAADPIAFTVIDQTASPARTITFTQSQLTALQNASGVTESYSSYNTFPTFKWSPDVTGIKLATLLAKAGITSAPTTRLIQIVGSDGLITSFTWKDLFVDARYCFPDGKTTAGKKLVDPLLDFSGMPATDSGRFLFGQLGPDDQTFNSFTRFLYGGKLVVTNKLASAWTPVTTASVKSGSSVAVGSKLTFTIPAADSAAKVCYTTDGSKPTATSAYYNYSNWVTPAQFALSFSSAGTVTIKVIVTGCGGLDSAVTSFTYAVGGSGASGGGSGSVSGGGGSSSGGSGSSSTPGTTNNSSTGPTVLTVVDERTGKRTGLSVVDLATVARSEGSKTYRYSAYNTFPSVKSLSGTGPTVKGIFSKAGVSTPRANELITVASGDGFSTNITYGDMTSGRSYYPNGSSGTAQGAQGGSGARAGAVSVPAAIITDHLNGTFAIGQRQPNDQTYDAFVQNVANGGVITIRKSDASALAAVTKTSPANPAVVKVGDTINFLLPTSIGRAKVYYTTDGSTPTSASQMYNISAWKQSGGPADAAPKITHTGKTVIKTVVIGRGNLPSSVSELVFATDAADLKGVPGADAAVKAAAAATSAAQSATDATSSAGTGTTTGQSGASTGAVAAVKNLGAKVFGSEAKKVLGVPWGALIIALIVVVALGIVSGKLFAAKNAKKEAE